MNYVQKQETARRNAFEVGLRIGKQQAFDFLQMVLRTKHGMGEKRLWEVIQDINSLEAEFSPAFNIRHPECDYYRDKMDRALDEGCGKEHPLIPFAERYADLKQVTYGRQR